MKAEVVEEILHGNLGFKDFSVQFLNSHEDDAGEVRDQLRGRVEAMFEGYRRAVDELVQSARTVIDNFEDEQAQDILRQATSMIRSWVTQHGTTGAVQREIERSLLVEIEESHPSTIHATMRRRGGWYNLDYGHHLAYGARIMVSSVLRHRVRSFEEHCETFLNEPEHEHARSLLNQAGRAMKRAYGVVAQRAQVLGDTWFHEELEADDPFWREGVDRWGRGQGYVPDVVNLNGKWFSDHHEVNDRVKAMVEREWSRAMDVVLEMLEQE